MIYADVSVTQNMISTCNDHNNAGLHLFSFSAVVVIENKHPMVVLKTRAFWTLWFMFLVNGQAVQFAATLYKVRGLNRLELTGGV